MYKNYIKPTLDRFLAIIILVVMLPVLLLISVFILVTMGSPVIFRQERVGKDFQTFIMYKFRTMREPKEGENRLLSDANRVTKLGSFLRKTSLDELPEIINVIKGDMSLIGPRPLLNLHIDLFNEVEKKRYEVKPGITGLAQVLGRQSLSFKQRAKLDNEYVEKISFWQDCKILFHTIGVVFLGNGVNTGQRFEEVDDVGLEKIIKQQ
jgi:undecaprenyl phosphate N,N'-diacetylbacillosamine 1-phosphate transferase